MSRSILTARATRRRDRDEGLAMFFVLTCMLVSAALVAAVLGVVVSELAPTSYERKAARTISASEAGLQAGLSMIRNATSASMSGITGDIKKLPCADASPLTGTVGGGPGNLAWTVRIRYYTTDPSGQTATWRTNNALVCTTGQGPTAVPQYALLESAATGDAAAGLPTTWGDRSQQLVYTFSRTDQNVLGGNVHTGQYSTDGSKCWSAPSASPSAGATLSLALCDPTDNRQIFSYRTDYSLALSATQTSMVPPVGGMCVSGDPVGYNDPSDSGAQADTAIPVGSPTWEVVGPVSGTGVQLNGSTQYLQTTKSLPYAASSTTAIWFRTSTPGGFLSQFANAQDPNAASNWDNQLYMTSTGALVFGVWSNSLAAPVTVTTPGTYTDGNWHFAVGSVGSAGVKLYVDGVLLGTSLSATAAQNHTGYWSLGAGKLSGSWPSMPANRFFTGSLAHAATWNTQLSDLTVTSLYSQTTYSGFQSAVAGLSPNTYWPLGGDQAVLSVTLQPCSNTNPQRWSYNSGGQFQLSKLDGSSLSSQCLYADDVVGAQVVSVNCSSGRDWTPDPTVGAGAAGAATQQLVNYGEFGRCMDITNWDLNHTYLIDWPCKQDPTQPAPANQRWVYNSGTQAIVTQYNTLYCLTTATTTGGYVTTKLCTGAANQKWTMYGDTGVRATSYTIVDSSGRCIGLGDPNTTEGAGLAQWSTIIATTCNGSLEQKWNAPAATTSSGVSSQRETTNGK